MTDSIARRGPGRPRRADAGDTKATLQRAALRLFAQHGYAGTSIRAIAREVGLSESVLYAHFSSKQAIFDAVLAEFGPQSPIDTALRVDIRLIETDPPRYLRELVQALVAEWDTEDARLLISLMARDGLMHGPALQDALSAMRTATTQLFDTWITAGAIPAERGPAAYLAMLFTGPIGLLRMLHLHADADEEQRAAAQQAILDHVDAFIRVLMST